MPIAYAPPWIHTITGSPAPGPGSGDQTLIVSQSSPAASRAKLSMPNAAACGGGGPYDTASRTPSHPRTGRGAAKRSAPTGDSANGMPRKTATPASQLPRSVPADARTSGRDPDGVDAVAVITHPSCAPGRSQQTPALRTPIETGPAGPVSCVRVWIPTGFACPGQPTHAPGSRSSVVRRRPPLSRYRWTAG